MHTVLTISALTALMNNKVIQVKAGQMFPAYNMPTWTRACPFKWEMAGAIRGQMGVITRDGSEAPEVSQYLYENDPVFAASSAAAESDVLGTMVGIHRTITGHNNPTLGVACRATRTENTPCFQYRDISPAWWYSQTGSKVEEEGLTPLPTWWVKVSKSDTKLLDLASGRKVPVKQIRHLPWAVEPFEELISGDRWKWFMQFRGGTAQWARRHGIQDIYLGYDQEVELDVVHATPCNNKDPLSVYRGASKKQIVAICNGEEYIPHKLRHNNVKNVRTMSQIFHDQYSGLGEQDMDDKALFADAV